jgi:proteic killer suppression protein
MALKIEFTKSAEKEFHKAPKVIKDKVLRWLDSLIEVGWANTCLEGGKGLHDEPLLGNREGQRSIRLNKSWRLIYVLDKGELVIITVIRISKHDYR